jgi:hypothetical protein
VSATTTEQDINWSLLDRLRRKDHAHQRQVELPDNVHVGVGEVLGEALAAQHLLDLAGIPCDEGYRGDLDARTFLALWTINDLKDRLSRISSWHSRKTADGGMVGDFCTECGHVWPCETRRMADGTYVDEEES